MIPTMILFGLMFGRWWKTALVLSALIWPTYVMLDGVQTGFGAPLGAGALGAANGLVGILLHQILLRAARLTVNRQRADSRTQRSQGHG